MSRASRCGRPRGLADSESIVWPAGFFAFLATGIVVIVASVVLMQQATAPEAQPSGAP